MSTLGLAAKLPSNGRLTEFCGTSLYMAPEMLLSTGYDTGIDVWACGIIAYLLILGVYPYGEGCLHKKEILTAIRTGKVLPTFRAQNGSKSPSDEALQFIKLLLDRNPKERISAKKALTLPYLGSSASQSKTSHPALAEKPQRKRCKKLRGIIAALALECDDRIYHDKGPSIRRHSNVACPTRAIVGVMESSSLKVADGCKKLKDELETQSHCDLTSSTRAVTDDVIEPPRAKAAYMKLEDDLETRLSSCSTRDHEDAIDNVDVSSDEEPHANAIPHMHCEAALSCANGIKRVCQKI